MHESRHKANPSLPSRPILSALLLLVVACESQEKLDPKLPTPSPSAATSAPAAHGQAAHGQAAHGQAAHGQAAHGQAAPSPTPRADAPVETRLRALRTARASVFAVHTVRDFDAYQKAFDSHESERREAGAVGHVMSRVIGQPNRVIVHFAVESPEKLKAFFRSPAYDALLDAPGAPDASLLWTADNSLVELPTEPLTQTSSLYEKFEVENFDALRSSLAEATADLKKQGIVLFGLHRSTENGNVVIVHLVAQDRATLERVYAGPAFSRAREVSGAKTERRPLLAEDVH